jgi:Domain of unknown function (DUF4166)
MTAAGMVDASPFAPLLQSVAPRLAAPLRHQYLLSPADRHRLRLTGRMARVWHRPSWIRPLLRLLACGEILFPETGRDVPAEMVVTAGRAGDGRPCQVWRRTFAFGHRRRHLSAVHVYDAGRRTIVERLGPAGLVRVPWRIGVGPEGDLHIETDRVWLGPLRLPRCLGAEVIATERALGPRTIHIRLAVHHPLLGPVFGYDGRFEVSREPLG